MKGVSQELAYHCGYLMGLISYLKGSPEDLKNLVNLGFNETELENLSNSLSNLAKTFYRIDPTQIPPR